MHPNTRSPPLSSAWRRHFTKPTQPAPILPQVCRGIWLLLSRHAACPASIQCQSHLPSRTPSRHCHRSTRLTSRAQTLHSTHSCALTRMERLRSHTSSHTPVRTPCSARPAVRSPPTRLIRVQRPTAGPWTTSRHQIPAFACLMSGLTSRLRLVQTTSSRQALRST